MKRRNLLWLVCLLTAAPGGGQAAPGAVSPPAAAGTGPGVAAPPASVARVVAVSPDLRLNHIIDVRVDGLQAWVHGGGTPWKLVPYLDQRALTGLYPVAVDTANGTLQFLLQSRTDNADTWTHLLSPLAFERAVRFSVGLEHQDALATAFDRPDGRVQLVVIDRWWSAFSAALVLMLGLSFTRLGMRTALLMDVVDEAAGAEATRYSLAKVQFALWFFVILSAYLVIWLSTGNFNSLNTSVVAVLGISAGTAVGDGLLRSGPAPAVANPPHARWRHWRGFLDDLVCDGQGHSISRFQMLAWTVVLIVVFLADVFDDLVMPVMGPELLYLLGLSSGTYVAHRRTDPVGPGTPPPSPLTAPTTTHGP